MEGEEEEEEEAGAEGWEGLGQSGWCLDSNPAGGGRGSGGGGSDGRGAVGPNEVEIDDEFGRALVVAIGSRCVVCGNA